MVSFDHPPEYLDRLRTEVKSWLSIGVEALYGCYEHGEALTGYFLSNSREDTPGENEGRCFITTARAYAALARVDQVVGLRKLIGGDEPSSGDPFPVELALDSVVKDVHRGKVRGLKPPETRLHLARLADLVFAAKYFARFKDGVRAGEANDATMEELQAELRDVIRTDVPTNGKSGERGEIALVKDHSYTRHYYVTLQVARARHVVNRGLGGAQKRMLTASQIKQITDRTRSYCIEQSFYAEKDVQYKHDAVNHAMATVLYGMFASRADPELCVDFLKAIERSQMPSGAWLATHPIVREGIGPWHVSSHEVALALTWLYFQPQIPEAGRELVLDVLERYFKNWVVPTYVHEVVDRVPPSDASWPKGCPGWFDDHTVAPTSTEGWATATVVHFLANYCAVLDDFINRRVIEYLQIDNDSSWYLIDKTAKKERRSRKWRDLSSPTSDWGVIWPDLPPDSFAWTPEADPTEELTRKWLDPTREVGPDGKLSGGGSAELAKSLIEPILTSPRGMPGRDVPYRAGILPGPPGTGKTTLAKVIAEILEWPFVPVPSSVFFTRGFDGSEVRATEVFEQLNYLSRCVIFFDEFEEFFRDRSTPDDRAGPGHDRTIAAFTTAAMLPRLQVLHDKHACVVMLATNYMPRIDKAIKRRGRFDFQFHIDYPTPSQARQFVMTRRGYDRKVQDLVSEAIEMAFGAQAEEKPRPELQMAQLWSALTRAKKRLTERLSKEDIIKELIDKFTIEYSEELPDLGRDPQLKPKQTTTDV